MTETPQAGPRVRDRSLNDVRAVIPAKCYERPTAPSARALAQAWVLYVIPVVGLVLTNRWWAVVGLELLAGLAVAGLFVLGHDASHGALLESSKANLLWARICMIPSIHLESAWDLGHNRIHHGYTTREGFDFVWHPLSVAQYRELSAFRRFQHKVEWSFLGSGAYFLRTVWWEKMLRFKANDKRRGAIRTDKIIVGATWAIATALLAVIGYRMGGVAGAIWTPVKALAIPFLLFGHIIGWTVYVHHVAPDIRWWPRREWSQFKGQMESTTILKTPRLINKLWFHNIFVHVPHHVDVRIPFHQLPAAATAIAAAFPETVRTSKLSLRDYVAGAKACKLYDFQAGTWLTYAAAAAVTVPVSPVSAGAPASAAV